MKVEFKPITINDREVITSFTFPSDYKNCDFAFANMCSWRFLYDSEFAVTGGFLLIRFWIEDKTRLVYMTPVGDGNMAQAVKLLEEDSQAHGHPLCMLGVTPDAQEKLEEAMPGAFKYLPERDYYDYIYLREDLQELKGKKYQPKRNHINKFVDKYTYKYMPITPELVPECLDLEAKWFYANREKNEDDELSDERRSMIYALKHYDELGLIGGGLCVNNEIVAFTFGSPINHNTFGVHVEKADVAYEGAFAMINKEFVSHLPEQYIFINREEDLGLPGLRQSKLSYHPTILLEKNVAVKRTDR